MVEKYNKRMQQRIVCFIDKIGVRCKGLVRYKDLAKQRVEIVSSLISSVSEKERNK